MWFALDDVQIANDSGFLHTRHDWWRIYTKRRRKFNNKKIYSESTENLLYSRLSSECSSQNKNGDNEPMLYFSSFDKYITKQSYTWFFKSDVNLCDKTPVSLTPFEGGSSQCFIILFKFLRIFFKSTNLIKSFVIITV